VADINIGTRRLLSVSINDDGSRIFALDSESAIHVIDTSSFCLLRSITLDGSDFRYPFARHLLPNSREALFIEETKLSLINLSRGAKETLKYEYDLRNRSAGVSWISPSEDRLLFLDGEHRVNILTLHTKKPQATKIEIPFTIQDAIWIDENHLLLKGDTLGQSIFNLSTLKFYRNVKIVKQDPKTSEAKFLFSNKSRILVIYQDSEITLHEYSMLLSYLFLRHQGKTILSSLPYFLFKECLFF